MKNIISLIAAMVISVGMVSAPAFAGSNPCNPCAMKQHMNPCNPCSMKKHMNPRNPCSMKKHMNPCNPCSMKKHMNPCNPCSMKKSMNPCSMKANPCSMNPCSANQNTPIRKHAFDNFQQAVALGKKMWSDESLGTSGVACLSCHAEYDLLHLERNQNFPHFVKMVGDVVSLDQMINYCMLNPMKGNQFEKNSKELTAMAAYYRSYRMQYLKEQRHK
ncbi:MAG: hypothetical protein Q9M16_03515 [Mariprofundus sp.]|nr:hypothetical protein [Mariprofundus sp.]